jgi:IS5 family transposase
LQSSLFAPRPKNEIAQELEAVSRVLDANPEILALVYQDLVGLKSAATGRTGLTAEQVLRCAFLKQYRQLTSEELALYLADSRSFQAFSRLAEEQYPSAATLQENIKTIQAATWEALHRLLVSYAAAAGMEKGRKIRLDATGVETNVHSPTDALLLQDGVGVITRLLVRGQELRPLPACRFADHRRAVKKRVVRIRDAKKPQVRVQAYRELLHLAAQTRGYALEAIAALSGEEIYGRAPLKTAADGGFASKENLRRAKKQGVRDVAFSKRRGLPVLEMVKSLWVYKKLKNFRAGIEAPSPP